MSGVVFIMIIRSMIFLYFFDFGPAFMLYVPIVGPPGPSDFVVYGPSCDSLIFIV